MCMNKFIEGMRTSNDVWLIRSIPKLGLASALD